MVKLKGILFDYGHTLVYFPQIEKTHTIAARNVQRVLEELGVSVNAVRIQKLVRNIAKRPDTVVLKMKEEFKEILAILGIKKYSEKDLQEIIHSYWRPFIKNVHVRRGVKKILKYLKRRRWKLGIVANIWSGGMNPVLEMFGLEKFFNTMVASIDLGFKKPDPRIFQLALNRLELGPEEVMMVGDNPRTDIQGAHEVGIITVRLMRGPNRTKPDLIDPDFKIRNISELKSIFHACAM